MSEYKYQLTHLPSELIDLLKGESLTIISFEQLDQEIFEYFQLLFNNTSEIPPYKISEKQWKTELDIMLSRFPSVAPIYHYPHFFDECVSGLSNEFFCEMATRLSNLRHITNPLKIGSFVSTRSPLYQGDQQIAFDERWALLPLSAKARLRLLLSEKFLPMIEVDAVETGITP
ncbi:hypothetical protein ACLS0F_06720 [Avibacterium endocarditidis]|uniref:hypothetical protein n=1 Tax=Avibacterium endocarditidis TaxID=380674 RepID=UPI003BF77A07